MNIVLLVIIQNMATETNTKILALGVNRPAVTADRITEITPMLLAIPNAVPENLNKILQI